MTIFLKLFLGPVTLAALFQKIWATKISKHQHLFWYITTDISPIFVDPLKEFFIPNASVICQYKSNS